MTLTITDTEMTSTATAHRAWRTDKGWRVTWRTGAVWDRNQAITAMSIAEHVDLSGFHEDDPQIHDWARELGMTASDAAHMVTDPFSRNPGCAEPGHCRIHDQW